MGVRKYINPYLPKFMRSPPWRGYEEFAFTSKQNPAEDIRDKYGFSGDIVDIFVNNTENVVHKWHHYLPIYDRYFSRFRGSSFRFLEIGVSKGGSLQMWRKYFGPDAVIFGIDIDENCRQYDGQAAQVRIGSQDDPEFLRAVVAEMGGIDLVLDDGSHVMKHIKASLECLYPLLGEGGVYMIEDLHTAYWEQFGGSAKAPTNFFRYLDEMVDDMHHWYHEGPIRRPGIGDACSAIHIHDSIAVIEKTRVHRPVHSKIS